MPGEDLSHSDFIVGIDLGITRPDALKTLQQRAAQLRVFSESGKRFHPKAIYLRSEENETLIIGSNNLTSSGIASNHELSIMLHRNEESEPLFGNFLAHFEALKIHECCVIPDESFYENYVSSTLHAELLTSLRNQTPPILDSKTVTLSSLDQAETRTVSDFLKTLAEQFPKLERKKGNTPRQHPLSRRNEEEFIPRFKELIATASRGRLNVNSRICTNAHWRIAPRSAPIISSESRRTIWIPRAVAPFTSTFHPIIAPGF